MTTHNTNTRILLCGDFHGDTSHAIAMGRIATKESCGAIVQLGDFGFWPKQYPKYMDKLRRNIPVPIYWIDGNHEDFFMLEDVLQWADTTQEGFFCVHDGIFYIPRGSAWKWGNTSFVACGGAYSIDRRDRIMGNSFFHEELITQRDYAKTISHAECDVLLTHDAPLITKIHSGIFNDRNTATNRTAVQGMMDHYSPSYLFHGHYHHYYKEFHNETLVVGLERHAKDNSWIVFDIDKKEIV